MDKPAYNEMKKIVKHYIDNDRRKKIADIGSYNVNGSYRTIFEPNHEYIGFDITMGPNVDLVMENEFNIPSDDNLFDIVISGSCLEHCNNPFILTKEMCRILKPNGGIILCAPQKWPIHRYPLDCWRILPDGMDKLISASGLQTIDIYTQNQFTIRHGILKMTYGIGVKNDMLS